MNELIENVGCENYLQGVFEHVAHSPLVDAGRFLSIKDSRITIPGEGLKDSYAETWFFIDVMRPEGDHAGLARISTDYWLLSHEAIVDACSWYETVHCGLVDERFCVFADVPIDGSGFAKAAANILDACLILDGAIVTATAFDIAENPNLEPIEFDCNTLLKSFGFGEASSTIAASFERECRRPYERMLAKYALPFNLQALADAGIMDAIVAENGDKFFCLHALLWRRWFFCSEIVRALQRRGFSNGQIAFIAINDEGLFQIPETRDVAEMICERIKSSTFDPKDVNRWNAYTATETGPLIGFL